MRWTLNRYARWRHGGWARRIALFLFLRRSFVQLYLLDSLFVIGFNNPQGLIVDVIRVEFPWSQRED